MIKLALPALTCALLLTACPASGGSGNPPPAGDTIKPTVTLSRSVSDNSGIVTLTAAAADTSGVTKVEFYQGTTLLGTDTQSPYTFPVDISESRTNFTAKAYDAAGNVGTSAVFDIVTQYQGLWDWRLTNTGGAAVDSGQALFFAEGTSTNGVLGLGAYENLAQTKSGLSIMGPLTAGGLDVVFSLGTATPPTFYFVGLDSDKTMATVQGKAQFQGQGAIVDAAGNIVQEVNVTLTQTSTLLSASAQSIAGLRLQPGTLKTSPDLLRAAASLLNR